MTKNSPDTPSLGAVLIAFAAVYFIWGSTYLGIRFAIETMPPFTMSAWRFLSAGLILFLGSTGLGAGWPKAVHWRSAAIVGILLLVSGNGLLAWAEQYVPSGVAALIVATVPLWMVVLDALSPGGSRPGTAVVVGLVLGLVGIGVLVGPGEIGGGSVHVGGALAICFAAFSWAVGSLYSRRAPQSASTLQNVGMQMLVGGGVLFLVGLGLGERLDWEAVSGRSAWALAYLAIFGGVVSYSAYVWLLKVSTPAKVSTYAYVNPVVAVFLGWALGGEALSSRVFLSTLAVVSAVVLISRAKKPAPSPAEPRGEDLTPGSSIMEGRRS